MPAKVIPEAAPKPTVKKPSRKGQIEIDPTPTTIGEGIFNHSTKGARYEGQWQRFDGVIKRHGNGIYIDSGTTYDGQFSEDLYHGNGVYTAIDGSTYRGEWKLGKMHGKGTYTWPDGSSYEGNFEEGKIAGEGVYLDNNKRVWTGSFKDEFGIFDSAPIS